MNQSEEIVNPRDTVIALVRVSPERENQQFRTLSLHTSKITVPARWLWAWKTINSKVILRN